MLIFIENTPRTYAWGSKEALPDMLGRKPTGEPQAELWLGTHPGSPAHIAKATPEDRTLIDLVQSDPELYGVDGGPLPFLLKVLAIERPLSLQVHPDLAQARAGFAAEEAAGVPLGARERNYGDPNHKPELLVALTEVTALSGFRELGEVRRELLAFAGRLRDTAGAGASADAKPEAGAEPKPEPQAEPQADADADAAAGALEAIAGRLGGGDEQAARREFLLWAFSGDALVDRAVEALGFSLDAAAGAVVTAGAGAGSAQSAHDPERIAALRCIAASYPGDPGLLVALLLHHVRLQPGDALYVSARQLHAYLGGVGVEVMAASDNVLRAGLTPKHVDIAELCRIVDTATVEAPRFSHERVSPGLVAWRPGVPDFELLRARLCGHDDVDSLSPCAECLSGSAARATISATHPLVCVVTRGRVRIERVDADLSEVVTAKRGQSIYVSAGGAVALTGTGEVFIATVGEVGDRSGGSAHGG